MFGAAVAAVALGAVAETTADSSVFNLSMTVKTAAKKTGDTYLSQTTKKVSGVLVDEEVAFWEGSGKKAVYLGSDTYKKDLNFVGVKSDRAMCRIDFEVKDTWFDLVGFSSDTSASGNFVGEYDDVYAYGNWSLKENKSAEKKLADGKTLTEAINFPAGVKEEIAAWANRTDLQKELANATTVADYVAIFQKAAAIATANSAKSVSAFQTAYTEWTNDCMIAKAALNDFDNEYEYVCASNTITGTTWPSDDYISASNAVVAQDAVLVDASNDLLIASARVDSCYTVLTNLIYNTELKATQAKIDSASNDWNNAKIVYADQQKAVTKEEGRRAELQGFADDCKAPFVANDAILKGWAASEYTRKATMGGYIDNNGNVTNVLAFKWYYVADNATNRIDYANAYNYANKEKFKLVAAYDKPTTVDDSYVLTRGEYDCGNYPYWIDRPAKISFVYEKYDVVEAECERDADAAIYNDAYVAYGEAKEAADKLAAAPEDTKEEIEAQLCKQLEGVAKKYEIGKIVEK